MPIFFWNDSNNSKYRAAYFDNYASAWYHGDFVWINPNTGGVVMLGRSDSTLNPGGVRFGSAEIYNIVDGFKEIEDSLVIGQKMGDDERVVLFVKMVKGMFLKDELVERIKKAIREHLSPRHVPAAILAIRSIPVSSVL
jgi:acetoacetyl-CoA synthetase